MTYKEYQDHITIGKCKNCGSTIYDWDIMADMCTWGCWDCETEQLYGEIIKEEV